MLESCIETSILFVLYFMPSLEVWSRSLSAPPLLRGVQGQFWQNRFSFRDWLWLSIVELGVCPLQTCNRVSNNHFIQPAQLSPQKMKVCRRYWQLLISQHITASKIGGKRNKELNIHHLFLLEVDVYVLPPSIEPALQVSSCKHQ